MSYTDFIIRICIALLLSFLVGFERQWRKRAVGLRTNILVCLGAFLFVSMPIMLKENDIKMAAQVISGIGFLGAGIIIKDGQNIRGLNTAATLWCTAAIGVLCASGLLIEASIGTFLILSANIILRYIIKKIMDIQDKKSSKNQLLKIVISKDKEMFIRTTLIGLLAENEIVLKNIFSNTKEDKIEITAEIETNKDSSGHISNIISRFAMEPSVHSINVEKIEEDEEN